MEKRSACNRLHRPNMIRDMGFESFERLVMWSELFAKPNMKPTSPPLPPPRPMVLADLNVDPPDIDPYTSSSVSVSRDVFEDTILDKITFMSKDAEVLDLEASQSKKVGKCRSKTSKVEFLPDCVGMDIDPDQNGQGAPSSREEKVSSLKTGLAHVARKMPKNMHAHFILGLMYQRMGQPQKAILAYEMAAEILLRSEEEIDRPELLSVVQLHHAQCIMLESFENCSLDEELEGQELEEICSKLRESLKLDVRNASIWNTLGLLLLRTGRVQSSISVFSSLLEIVPGNLDCLGNLGVAHLQGGNLEFAERCFQDLLLKDQNHPSALVNYAVFLLYKHGSVISGAGANVKARTYADQAVAANVALECLLAAAKVDPRAAHIWTNLANAYNLAGDYKASGKCLEKAGKLEPNCLATRYAVGVHRVREAERFQNPNEQLTWAGNEMASVLREGDSITIEPPIAWAGLAMAHKAQHEIASVFEMERQELLEVKERAMCSLKQAIGEDPENAVQWHQIGLHCLCIQQFKTAQTYLKAAASRLENCIFTWSNLAISLQLLEQNSEAEEVYKRALSLAAPEHEHTIYCNLGNFYRQSKKYERAKAMFSKALELQPDYAPAYNNLGLVFVTQHRVEEAKFCFDKAIGLDPLLDAAKSNIVKVERLSRMDTTSP